MLLAAVKAKRMTFEIMRQLNQLSDQTRVLLQHGWSDEQANNLLLAGCYAPC